MVRMMGDWDRYWDGDGDGNGNRGKGYFKTHHVAPSSGRKLAQQP